MSDKVIVVFMMWGQECQTVFDATSEHSPLEWLWIMYDRGWLYPSEIVSEDGVVIFDKEQLLAELKDK